jgi:hypothetical protein
MESVDKRRKQLGDPGRGEVGVEVTGYQWRGKYANIQIVIFTVHNL